MTEWNAVEYTQRSGLQIAMAEEVLALLKLEGSERVLDVGCGDGRITAEIANRLSRGTVIGIDASHRMIDLAASRFPRLNTRIFTSNGATRATSASNRSSI